MPAVPKRKGVLAAKAGGSREEVVAKKESHAPLAFLEGYREALRSKKTECLMALGVNLKRLAESENGLGPDMAQLSHDEFIGLRLNRVLYGQLRQVEAALDRLDAGEYGQCAGCGGTIPRKRLQAVPWAHYCVDCQQEAARAEDAELALSVK